MTLVASGAFHFWCREVKNSTRTQLSANLSLIPSQIADSQDLLAMYSPLYSPWSVANKSDPDPGAALLLKYEWIAKMKDQDHQPPTNHTHPPQKKLDMFLHLTTANCQILLPGACCHKKQGHIIECRI